MARRITNEQRRRAEQIVRRWTWAVGLSVPADRSVEQGAVGEMAVALLTQLLGDERRTRRNAGVTARNGGVTGTGSRSVRFSPSRELHRD